jgi:Zn-dependent peptidase ImmA (M78 family)
LYTDREIETIVRDLQARLWRDRKRLWDGSAPSDPVDILDPAIAVHLVGYEFLLADGLGQFQSGSGVIEVAGLIDRTSRTVHVSRQFPLPVQTFTAAHELGHAVLRPIGGGVHRDRAIDGPNQSRDRFELEADKFATYFLLPANLVRKRFEALFGTAMFFLSEETAFALCGLAIQDVRRKYSTRRHLSRLLAGAEQYNGRHFVSLAVQFRVSIEAMAIRLEELELLSR